MNKEFGSDFHYIFSEKGQGQFLSKQDNVSLFFSGRVAVYNLLQFGIKKYGWKKVGFPSYYCHEVIDFCQDLNIEIILYHYNPWEDNDIVWNDEEGSVFVNVNFFGIKKAEIGFLKKTIIIEDVTHNILSIGESSAHYFFGSLRKQLPIGVGGFCKLKENEVFTGLSETAKANEAYLKKSTAMFLKTEYLKNRLDNNLLYRSYYQSAEEMFENKSTNSVMPVQAVAQLDTFPIEDYIHTTQENISFGIQHIKVTDDFQIFNKNNGFCLVLYCKSNQIREDLRKYLIDHKIFPAVLWPHQILDQDKDLQNKILCIHMDFRYSKEEVKYISNRINSFFENV